MNTINIKFSILVVLITVLSLRAFSSGDNSDLEEWYFEHKDQLVLVKALMGKNPKIKRVEPALDIQFIPGSSDFTEDDMEFYRRIELICNQIGAIRFLGYWDDEELGTFRVDVKSKGLMTSGLLFSIVYEEDKEYIGKFSPEERLYTPLDTENWYQLRIVNK